MNDVTHPKTADEVAYEIEAAGRKAIALQANVSRAAEVQRIYAIGLGTIRTPAKPAAAIRPRPTPASRPSRSKRDAEPGDIAQAAT